MSDYGDYDTDEDFTGYADEEYDIEEGFFDPDSVVNGHDKDEEDILQDRLADAPEKGEGEEEQDMEEKDDEESEEESEEEEEVAPKTVSRVVPSNLRKTNPILTKFEYSYLVSQRAMAIENGSPLMNTQTKLIHSIDIAKEETMMGLNPIIIQRVLPSGDIEEWKCKELRLPKYYI
jgi:DNA-directed RNA polymerase subunit K/omega